MRGAAALAATLSAAMLLAACAGGPNLRDGRLARDVPLVAQPGDVVATEIAFARTAQEKGQWTAFAEFAAKDAVMFVPEPVNAQDWLKGRANAPEAVRWQVHRVWSSCDGSLAVSTGAYQQPDGSFGRFVTVWERQDKGGYKWVLDAGLPLGEPLEEPDMIGAEVADCAGSGDIAMWHRRKDQLGIGLGYSEDGTLAYYWAVNEDRSLTLLVRMMHDGTMRDVFSSGLS